MKSFVAAAHSEHVGGSCRERKVLRGREKRPGKEVGREVLRTCLSPERAREEVLGHEKGPVKTS